MDRKHEKSIRPLAEQELESVSGAGDISPNMAVNFGAYGTAVAGSGNKTVGGQNNTTTIDSFNVLALLGIPAPKDC